MKQRECAKWLFFPLAVKESELLSREDFHVTSLPTISLSLPAVFLVADFPLEH